MSKWSLIAGSCVALAVVVGIFTGQSRESAMAHALTESLLQSQSRPVTGIVDFDSFSKLPPPVTRYFKHVLTHNQTLIKTVRIQQSGVLRTRTTTDVWSPFTASQVVVPPATGFIWNARVETPFTTHVRVLDSYIAGTGAGRVSILSALAVASASGDPELNSGALHRYLAEAVWYPTALLPQSGVVWIPINDHAAMAEIVDGGTAVSLEFRFNDAGEVIGIYAPARFGRFDGTYVQMPWEGRFRDYRTHGDMRIPNYGEVGWYEGEALQVVWKGNLREVEYQFER